ncbi:MAG: exosortase/archaeosortase family protein [Chloroflexi bacterium]|nr:MAG: exosortase/archaeosortase family protein [Chloroflexota bacterium]
MPRTAPHGSHTTADRSHRNSPWRPSCLRASWVCCSLHPRCPSGRAGGSGGIRDYRVRLTSEPRRRGETDRHAHRDCVDRAPHPAVLLDIRRAPSAYGGSLLYVGTGAGSLALYISWNCVGWQTVLFLLVSMATGLQGEYTLRSRVETVALGVLGIAMLNILRITVVAVVAYLFGQLPAVIVHDYGSVIATVAFLMAFWAFAYNVVLERIGGDPEERSPEQGSNALSSVATVPS